MTGKNVGHARGVLRGALSKLVLNESILEAGNALRAVEYAALVFIEQIDPAAGGVLEALHSDAVELASLLALSEEDRAHAEARNHADWGPAHFYLERQSAAARRELGKRTWDLYGLAELVDLSAPSNLRPAGRPATPDDYAPVSVPDVDGTFPENGLDRLRGIVTEKGGSNGS